MSTKNRFMLKGILLSALLVGVVLTFIATGVGKKKTRSNHWMSWNVRFQKGTDQKTIDVYKQQCNDAIKKYLQSVNANLAPTLQWRELNESKFSVNIDLLSTNHTNYTYSMDSVVTPPCGPKPPPSYTIDGKEVVVEVICNE